jgi:hypothetical protein
MTSKAIKLTDIQVASITKLIPSQSHKQFIKFIAKNPDSTTAKVLGQTGINDIVETSQMVAEPLFKKGFYLCYRMTESKPEPTEQWRIEKIPYHAEHCETAEELREYVNQLAEALDFNQELRGEA